MPDEVEPKAMSQREIDELFADLGGESATAPETERKPEESNLVPAQSSAPQAAVEPRASSSGSTAAPAPTPDQIEDALQGAISTSDSALTQGDIDSLLAGLEQPAESGDAANLAGEGPPTETLTPEGLKKLIAEQSGNTQSAEKIGSGVINQNDVDALLAQMQAASGEVPRPSAEAETLIAPTEQTAADAILSSQVASQPSAAMQVAPVAAYLSPEELRGGRYLLIAAVGLLAVCAVTLLLVVSAVNRLSVELRAERTAGEVPNDDFDLALEAARGYLGSDEVVQQQRGLKHIARMKDIYTDDPPRADAVALLLARHHLAQGAYAAAAREYAAIDTRSDRLLDDPAVYLEYARCLVEVGSLLRAESVLQELLANAAWYAQAELPDGGRRDATEIARHADLLRQAQVALGRLYQLASQSAAGGHS